MLCMLRLRSFSACAVECVAIQLEEVWKMRDFLSVGSDGCWPQDFLLDWSFWDILTIPFVVAWYVRAQLTREKISYGLDH